MTYPADRPPTVPTFPRYRNTLVTDDMGLIDKDWYEVVCCYLEYMMDNFGAGGCPTLLENHTFRGNASSQAEDTDSVLIYDGNGAKTTDDHPFGTDERFVNVILLPDGTAKPSPASYTEGTVLAYYRTV